MLAHSPHLPLVIDYFSADRDITAEQEGIMLALGQRDRVRRVRLQMPVPDLQKLVIAIDEEYPALEYLIIEPSTEVTSRALMLPGSLQAPHLRHLALKGFALPIGSRLLTTAVDLVTLALSLSHPSTHFQPNTLLRWLSFMPQLEALLIRFLFPVPNRDVERQLMPTPITPHLTLPNLRWFVFRGVSAFLEGVARQITTPRLEKLDVEFFKQLTFSNPRLLQFLNTTENFRFDNATLEFSRDEVHVKMYPLAGAVMQAVSIHVHCCHLDWQVSSVAQIFNSLSLIFATVEHLILKHMAHSRSSEEHNEVDHNEWHKLLRSFSNVKTLHVDNGIVKELSRSLRLGDEEHTMDLLPQLQELTYSASGNAGDAFTSFIDVRRNAGRSVTLVCTTPTMRGALWSLQYSYLSLESENFVRGGRKRSRLPPPTQQFAPRTSYRKFSPPLPIRDDQSGF
jgi:hypothetical protein